MKRLVLVLAIAFGGACSDDSTPSKPNTSNQTNNTADAGSDAQAPDASFEGVRNCEVDADCDDGLACTTDTCIDQPGQGKICAWAIAADTCLIDGVCRASGDADPSGCGTCDPATPSTWSGVADGTPCDDSDVCTFNTACSAGACVGTDVDCSDGNECTTDSCDPIQGCSSVAVDDGTACDDASACTTSDLCVAGECTGQALSCDDGNECTDDVCDDVTGCANTNNTASCDDGDPCTTGDTCGDGVCNSGGPESCDDQNPCTIDVCHAVAGCQHLPTNNPCCSGQVSICDDGDPCTTDICDPTTADCSYTLNTASCNDGNACTENDTCNAGTCSGSPRSCDDGNSCTVDTCNINQGCFHAPQNSGSCDDGLACSTGDTCNAGVCVADTSQCLCTPTFTDAAKVNALALGNGTAVGEALDVDGDGDRDNALSPLGTFVNQPLTDALVGGSLVLVFEYIGFQPGPFTLALLTGGLDPANSTCDLQAATCNYLASRGALDPVSCAPVVTIPATRTGNFVAGGGPTTSVPVSIPLDASNVLNVTVYKARIEQTVTVGANGVTAFTGILAGAVTETDLNAAINALDPASLPLPPAQLISLLGTLAPNDIDTDNNGTLDAKSIALKLGGIDGNLTGVLP
ncbi:MAG: hypothetical protein R3E66_17760 [bacterium]